MTDTPQTPTDPALGMPSELLSELASVDWHAEHPDVHHLATGCPCETPTVVGGFAVRLITGQAPLSTTRSGQVATVIGVDLDHRPLVQLNILGDAIQMACDCGIDEQHPCLNISVNGVNIRQHALLDDEDVLQLLGDALANFAATIPAQDSDDSRG